jgi:hypothetical protein
MRARGRETVETLDLVVDRELTLRLESLDKRVYGLEPLRCSVVNGLQTLHRPSVGSISFPIGARM